MKYKYYIWEGTPLVFYNFLRKFLWVPLVIGGFSFVSYIQSWLSIQGYYTLWLFWADIAFTAGKFISLILAIYWLNKREWAGVLSLFTYQWIIVLYKCFEIWLLEEENKMAFMVIELIVGSIIFLPVLIYFVKRRPIFMPTIHKVNFMEDIQNMDEKKPDQEDRPKRESQENAPIEKKEQLYICCPDCGSLCLYEDTRCACGHQFSKKLEREHKNRDIKIWIPVFVSVVILAASAAGWFLTYKGSEDYHALDQEHSKLQENYTRVLNAYHFSLDKVNDLESELDFYRDAVGIVGDTSDDYHVFGCEKLKDSESVVCTDIVFLRENDIEPCECVKNHFENYSSNMIIEYLSEQYVTANKSFIILGE